MGDLIPWLMCAVVCAVGVDAVLALRRSRRHDRERWAAQLEDGERLRGEADATHRAELQRLSAGHARQIAVLEQARVAALQGSERIRQFVARGMRWDESSHRLILAACERAGIRGVLATNLVFWPTDATADRNFVAQIDHVLLTGHGAAVIENKGWKGVVFDGVRPGEVHPTLGRLIGQAVPEAESAFAIQVRGSPVVFDGFEEAGRVTSLEVRVDQGSRSPTSQARAQARRLGSWCRARLGDTPWFETCVLYSHPDVVVHTRSAAAPGDTAHTTIAVGARGMDGFLRTLAAGAPDERLAPAQIAALRQLFADQGAVIVDLGASSSARNQMPREYGDRASA